MKMSVLANNIEFHNVKILGSTEGKTKEKKKKTPTLATKSLENSKE